MKAMTLAAGIAAALLYQGASDARATPGAALPKPAEAGTLVETVQVLRRNCTWVNNGWFYRRGGNYVVCRPYRPLGRGWTWHREGNRYGWYQPARKRWHYDRW
jgi:hypothetical protein